MAIVAKTTMVVELVDRVSDKLKTMTTNTKRTENELNRFAHRFMQVFRALLAFVIIKTVTVHLTNFFKSLIDVNSELEILRKRLALLVGGKNIESYVKSIQDLTIHTPFVVKDLMNATDAMEAFGINAKDNLKIIADWASGTGLDINDLAIRFAKIAAGSPRIKLLLNTAFLSVQRYRQELRKTGNTVDALRNTIEASFPDMARESSKTFKGMMTNISDIVHFIELYLGQGLFIVLRRFIKQLYEYLNNLLLTQSQKMVEIGDVFAANVVTIAKRMIIFSTAIGDIVKTIVEGMGGLKNAVIGLSVAFLVLSKGIKASIVSLGRYLVIATVFPDVVDALIGTLNDLKNAFKGKSVTSFSMALKGEEKYWLAIKDVLIGNTKGIAEYLKWYNGLTEAEKKSTKIRKDAIEAFAALMGSYPTKNLKSEADQIKAYAKELEDALKGLEKRADIKKYASGVQEFAANIRAMLSVRYLKKYGDEFTTILDQHSYTINKAREVVLKYIKETEEAEKKKGIIFDTASIAILVNLLKQIDAEQKRLEDSSSKLWSTFQNSIKSLKAEKEYWDELYAIDDKRLKKKAEELKITLKTKGEILNILIPELESLKTTEQKKKALVEIIDLLKKYGYIQVKTVNQLVDEYNSYEAMNKIFPNMFNLSKKYSEIREKIKERIKSEGTELEKIKDILALINLDAQKIISPIETQFAKIKELIQLRKLGYNISENEIYLQKKRLALIFEEALGNVKNRKDIIALLNEYSKIVDETSDKQEKLTQRMLERLIIRITDARMYLIKTGFQALNQFFTDFFTFLIDSFGKATNDWKKKIDDLWQHFKQAVLRALAEIMAAQMTKDFIETFFPKAGKTKKLKPELEKNLADQIMKDIQAALAAKTVTGKTGSTLGKSITEAAPAAGAAAAGTSLGTVGLIIAAILANATLMYQFERLVFKGGRGPIHDLLKSLKSAIGWQSGFEGWVTSPKLVKIAETAPEYVTVSKDEGPTRNTIVNFYSPIYGYQDFATKVSEASKIINRRKL